MFLVIFVLSCWFAGRCNHSLKPHCGDCESTRGTRKVLQFVVRSRRTTTFEVFRSPPRAIGPTHETLWRKVFPSSHIRHPFCTHHPTMALTWNNFGGPRINEGCTPHSTRRNPELSHTRLAWLQGPSSSIAQRLPPPSPISHGSLEMPPTNLIEKINTIQRKGSKQTWHSYSATFGEARRNKTDSYPILLQNISYKINNNRNPMQWPTPSKYFPTRGDDRHPQAQEHAGIR